MPEAQLDRFLFTLSLGYPGQDAEVLILEREEHADPLEGLQPVLTLEDVLQLQASALQVEVARPIKEYIVRLVMATRTHPDVILGVSPRGGVAVQRGAQAMALLRGRDFCTPDDVKAVAPASLPHRMMVRKRTLPAACQVVDALLSQVPVPV